MNITAEDLNALANSPSGEIFAKELIELMNAQTTAAIVTRATRLQTIVYNQKEIKNDGN